MNSERQDSLPVLIAGAGIGGLAAALSLLRRGIDCEVFEQAAELREVGAGLWVSMNGARVLMALGLESKLRDACIEADQRSIRLWNTGERWSLYKRANSSEAHQPLLLLRAHLLKLLVNEVRALKPDAIHLKAHCIGFTQDASEVQLKFKDGNVVRGRALIGADGAHSKIREQIIGSVPARYTNAIAWRGLVPVDRLAPHQRSHEVSTWVGPLAHVTAYPVRWEGTELMTFSGQVEHSDWQLESWSEKGALDDCIKDFSGWHPDIEDVIKNVDALHKWGLFVRQPLDKWSEGRVTLLGDACHSMVPYLGQGVNMAIEDACVVARCLEAMPDDPSVAFRTYQQARMERTAKVVRSSAAMQYTFHADALAEPARAKAYIEGNWSPAANAERYNWIYQYDATTVPLQ
jgi:salicylate hydroxylase